MNRPYAEVIGDPISQSKSPAIHGFWLKALGIDAEYHATQVTPETLADYLAARREDPLWRGCNVTMPLKRAVIEHLGALDSDAKAIGAINTIVHQDDGSLLGSNTDAAGFLDPLTPILRDQHLFRMARIIGAGGAARAIIYALAPHGFVFAVAARDPAKAEALLAELDPPGEHHTIGLEYFADATDFPFDDREGVLDLIINASPLGMTGHDPLQFDWSHAPPGAIAYDIVTSPVETEFLKAARDHGHQTIDGLSMLIGQAAPAFQRFFSATPPRDRDEELREVLTA